MYPTRRKINVVASTSVSETKMQSNKETSNTVDKEDNNSNKQMSLKKTNGKLIKPRSIVNTPPMTPRRSTGITPPMTPRRSVSSDSYDKSLTLSVVTVKKARPDFVEGIEKNKKTRSEPCTAIVKAGEFDSVALRKVNSLPAKTEHSDNKTEHVDLQTEEATNEKMKMAEEVKEIVVSAKSNEEEQIDNDEEEEEKGDDIDDVKEMNVAKENSNNRVSVVDVKKTYSQFQNRATPSPSAVRKIPSPVIKKATTVYSVRPTKDSFTEEEVNFTQPHSKLESLVDLVMWRDASRSALVFGFGTFLIISSSYANDLNFSFISVVAYIGLIYLGVMFIFKAVIHRGMVVVVDEEEEMHKKVGVREEDIKRMLRLIIPYLNESLLQLRALFSGDPSTTLKMGVVLFVLARCGSSITLWNLAKFGFLGAFTIPKIFISYSTHFSAYGNFWMKRFKDAWESCSHKKAVALGLFTLVWNLSSVIARVWAAFMLFVAIRYYQQKMVSMSDQDDEEEELLAEDEEEEEREQFHKPKMAPYMMMPNKLKKLS